ncbi:uncharacterized protein L969DRAFT_25787 [Mixia osmundae IAM 14324]|uniref:Cwf15/Cwc15 cell cycle control protein n=1 Tax=Mixia osmundae (strain CBS 9802 / IAM 14324 / JCM 22182 / KY 12970) TaxID=764103 RepID=G7DWI7_MIXOS|nr:uncharacterized protein L969DRAFT_25787 [Mixia osmundae IAM 14324]KEI37348.1 hypothetical protein L969DRAFT_25787 [Mixia osmundae IAM 14324]GAA94947.1 hypothetical protein E5Q_01602 [Mixia osmundae IAM 14324]
MSTAHRPTWTPAQGKEARANSRQVSVRQMASHTRLKFRQANQGTQSEIARRDLKLDLQRAEDEAKARKAKGLSGIVSETEAVSANRLLEDAPPAVTQYDQDAAALAAKVAQDDYADEQDAAEKRRKILLEGNLLDLDRDDSSDEDEARPTANKGKGKERAIEADGEAAEESSEEESDSDDDDEDETAQLMAELEKIKRERAEEKARQEEAANSAANADREAEVASGNPLLDLKAALNRGGSPTPSMMSSSTATTGFGVKRRWDDDVIFRNQAVQNDAPRKEFVNDLLRTDFHRKFMKRYIA